jgi:glycosyltransferase involved in cell wall biosynthesis
MVSAAGESAAPPRTLLSIVVPVLNEEHNIPRLYQAVGSVMAKVSSRYDWELIFTDNHSTDRSFEVLRELAARDKSVRVIRFSRNFGYQRSILTGYLSSRGDAVAQLDCDLQDSPELLLEFLARWEEGFQVVYGVRRRRREGWGITLVRKGFYRLINALSEHPLPLDAGDFRLLDRRIIDELCKIDDASPYLRGTIATLGFNQLGIPYDRNARTAGESKFPLRQLVGLAVDGILNHSLAPLRLATWFSAMLFVLCLIFSVVYLVGKFAAGSDWPAGFTTLALLVLLSTSANAFFFGLLGEYLGRIFRQVKHGPLTIVEAELNRPAGQDRDDAGSRPRAA